MTPDDLITEAEDDIQKPARHRRLKGRLIGFRRYLQDSGVSDYTVRTRLAGVRSFYQSYEIDIPKLQGDRRKPRVMEENKAVPTKDDIRETLKVCDPLEKAVLLSGVSSGLASNEIRNLTVRAFNDGYDAETGITTLQLNRAKTNTDFVTFLSPEASSAVLDYLAYRGRDVKRSGVKRERQIQKQRVTSDGYLFILRSVPDEYLETRDEALRQMTENAIQKLYQGISEKTGKCSPPGTYNVMRSHTMRKFFNSALLNAGADSFFVEYCMGHTLDSTRAAYFRADPAQLRDQYMEYIPNLTIEKSLDVSVSPAYLSVVEENTALKSDVARVSDEFRALWDEVNRLKDQNSESERYAEEFTGILQEEREIETRIEEITGLDYITALQTCDLTGLLPVESDRLISHRYRLKTDPVYRESYKNFVSGARRQRTEREKSETLARLFDKIGNANLPH